MRTMNTVAAQDLEVGMSVLGGWVISQLETYSDALAQLWTRVCYVGGDSQVFRATTQVSVDS